MKVFCAELNRSKSEMTAKAVVVLKKRNGLSLLKNYTTDAANLPTLSAEMPLNIAVDYYDVIAESVNMPPVKDLRTFRIMAYNKIKDNIDQNIDYLMAYKEDDMAESSSAVSKPYRVFLAPKSLLDECAAIGDDQRRELNIFTVSDFALSGIVKKFYPDKLVFHAYCDGGKVSVVVCRNDVVLYTRTNEVESASGSDLLGIYYENLNLTYMYVTKNLRLEIDLIVLSGDIAESHDLSKMISDFTSAPQAVLLPWSLVDNCNRTTFHKYMIPIALNFISDSYDFTPAEYKIEQGTNLLTSIASGITLVAIVLMLFLNIFAVKDYFHEKAKIGAQSKILQMRLKRYTKSIEDTEWRKFGLYYYMAHKNRWGGAFKIFADVENLVSLADYKRVDFDNYEGSRSLRIDGKVHFDSLSEIDEFKQSVDHEIKKLKIEKGYKVKDRSDFDMDNLIADVNLLLERKSDE